MLSNIKNPKELLNFMDIIKYGFTDEKNHNFYDKDFEENIDKWQLSSPERLLKVKHGHCFDQVELEREWFSKNNYQIHTYFLIFQLPYENPFSTHTFLVYEENNKYYLFEHSDFFNRGIHEYNSLEELLNTEYNYHLKTNMSQYKMNEQEKKSLSLYEYQKPKYSLNFVDFIDNILENGKKIR